MGFEIRGKVALITGGATGLGLGFAKVLLEKGLRGVTIADINEESGKRATEELEKEFGKGKAIFVKTDVTNRGQFENAFKKTVEHYNNVDILINNAGIMNDAVWEKEIAINFNGVVHGTLLGMEEYILNYKTGSEGVIVNISSIAGLLPNGVMPVYCGTKFAVMGMSQAFGDESHYERTKVRVIALCPGATATALANGLGLNTSLSEEYWKLFEPILKMLSYQSVDAVAAGLVTMLESAKTGSVWVIENGGEPYEFILPSRESFALK